MSIKSKLKKLGWLYELNACYKSAALKWKYRTTVARYTKTPASHSLYELMEQRSVENLRHNLLNRPPRIFFLGTDEQQDQCGTLQALEKIADLTYFTRSDGSYGQNAPSSPLVRKYDNAQRLWFLISELSDQGRAPDILIAQTWACLTEPEVFSRIRQAYGTFIVNISMDDRHQYWGDKIDDTWGGTYGLIPHLDLALTAAPECVDWYLKEGCPALFFPEASDPDIFHPMPELPKLHEVSFVGARYGIREKIVLALRKAGIQVSAYGSGWEGGRLPVDDVPRLFAQSKIVLGVGTIGHCSDFYALKMRDFDGPMSGSLYLTHDNPDLYSMYQVGDEIETYRSVDECIEKARCYLAHERRREQIAAAGRARALREHTWDQRFQQLFAYLRQQQADSGPSN